MLELTAVERVAVNSAVSGKVLNIARGELVEGESHTLDFAVRIFGPISRGHGTPGGSSEVPADGNLKGHAVALEVSTASGARLTALGGPDLAAQRGETLHATVRTPVAAWALA